MFDWIRAQVLRVMRVPRDPEPPAGAPGSIRVFRAGRNYYRIRLVRWGLGQVSAAIGIIFSIAILYWFKGEVDSASLARAQATATVAPVQPPAGATAPKPRATRTARLQRLSRVDLKDLAAHTPGWVVLVLEFFEIGGILLFVGQIPVTLAAVRLEFELHWYIVTDRSLRIRTGLLRLQESTMSFANLQQVEVKQDPLQRLLGLADVRVQSAGGGGGDNPHAREGDSLHTGIFHSVDNAPEIRDLILARLRVFRQAGLGDPEEQTTHAPETSAVPLPSTQPADALAAAHEVLAEARALRAALA